jgi:hypothetical protein
MHGLNSILWFPVASMVDLPPAISDLNLRLFQNMLRDIQATLAICNDVPVGLGWLMLEFGIIFWSIDWVDKVTTDEIIQSLFIPVAVFILVTYKYFWARCFSDAVDEEIPLPLAEWQVLFAKEGYRLKYLTEKPAHCWNYTDKYLLIEPVASQSGSFSLPTGNAPNDDTKINDGTLEPSCDFVTAHQQDEANYLVYFSRSFVRCNQSYHVVDLKPNSYGGQQIRIVSKAPILLILDVQVFDTVLGDIKDCCSMYSYKTALFLFPIYFVSFLIGIFLFPFHLVLQPPLLALYQAGHLCALASRE